MSTSPHLAQQAQLLRAAELGGRQTAGPQLLLHCRCERASNEIRRQVLTT